MEIRYCTYERTHTRIRMPARSYADTHAHTHTQTPRRPHIYTRMHMHAYATAGGVAIAVLQKWVCHRVDLKHKSDTQEALFAVIIAPGGTPIKVGTCYNKPGRYFPGQILKEFSELTFNGKKLPGIFAGLELPSSGIWIKDNK